MVLSIGAASLVVALAAFTAQAQQVSDPMQAPPAFGVPASPAPNARPLTQEQRDPDKRTERSLTPEEERERRIRMYDPFGGTDPRKRTAGDAGSGTARTLPSRSGQTGNAGPQVVDETLASQDNGDVNGADASQSYAGPAVLSRNYTLARPTMPQSVHWLPTLGFSTFYSTGLAPAANPQTVNTPTSSTYNPTSFGTQLSWGLSGTHRWKRDQLGLHYGGTASRYSGNGSFGGSNQNLSASLSHVVSRRLSVSASQSLQQTSSNYSFENQLAGANTDTNVNLAGNPSIGVYDQGTKQYASNVQVSWRPTSRVSASFGSGVFFVSRSGAGLLGATGYQSQSEVTRRYSRKFTVGGFYSHTTYIFTKHVATSDSNSFGVILGYSLNRQTNVRLRLGLSAVESQSLSTVRIDPAIAQIIGQSTGIVQTYTQSRLQDILAEFSRGLGHGRTVTVSYAKGLAPGNGVIQTSSRQSFSTGFSTALFRMYDLNVGAGFDSLAAIDRFSGSIQSQGAYSYSTRSMQLSVSRRYRHGISSNFSVAYQKVAGSQTFGYGDIIRITSGINWGGRDHHLW